MKIYTRTGDKGTSSLYTGERRAKTDAVFEALGSTDELSCHLGLCVSVAGEDAGLAALTKQLYVIQCDLQDINAHLGTPRDGGCKDVPASKLSKTDFSDEGRVQYLEACIDAMTSELPALSAFILPGGGLLASHLHLARVAARTAERRVHALAGYDPVVGAYLNRLSDYLFTAARWAAMKAGKADVIYRKGAAP